MMMFDDKVGGGGWLNDDVSKKYVQGKNLCLRARKKVFYEHFFFCVSQGDSLFKN